jgi:hypothetical protein
MLIYHLPLRCAIALSRQHIITFSVLKFGTSALTRHSARHRVGALSTVKCTGLLIFSEQSALIYCSINQLVFVIETALLL